MTTSVCLFFFSFSDALYLLWFIGYNLCSSLVELYCSVVIKKDPTEANTGLGDSDNVVNKSCIQYACQKNDRKALEFT